MAQIIGNRDTGDAITSENRIIRRVDDRIGLVEPNEAPLVTFLSQMKGGRKATDNQKVEWIEDDYVARWAQNGDTAITTGQTSMVVPDGTLFVAGDMFVVPGAVSSSVTGEVVRVTNVSTNTLTIARGVGGSTAATIDANAAVRILGSAYEESSLPPSAKTTIKSTKFSYCQIFKTTFEISKSMTASAAYGTPSGERQYQHMKRLKEHKISMNAAAIWGQASVDLTGGPSGQPIRTTSGIDSVISTNIVDAGGTLTRKTFEAFAREAFRYGSKQKILLASPLLVSAINQWGQSHLQLSPAAKVFGVDVNKIITGHGTFMMVRDWMLEDGVSGKNGFGGVGYCVDPKECSYFYLSGNGENRDTAIEEDVVKDGRDAYVDQILTEGGFKFMQEKRHAKLYNITDFAA